jgi:prepilin-type N-terminal cleavage/methylation domain-containing protein
MNKKIAQRGFSLIELLVVISIIALLAGILLTSIKRAQAKAADSQQLANIQQIKLAMQLYFNDHGGYPVCPNDSDPTLCCIGGNTCKLDTISVNGALTELTAYQHGHTEDQPQMALAYYATKLTTPIVYLCGNTDNSSGFPLCGTSDALVGYYTNGVWGVHPVDLGDNGNETPGNDGGSNGSGTVPVNSDPNTYGCTDPNASNWNPNAGVDNNSCVYGDTDSDGFTNDFDNCPALYDTTNACTDTDGDNVADNHDTCPYDFYNTCNNPPPPPPPPPTGCTDPAYVEYGSSNPCSTPVNNGSGSGSDNPPPPPPPPPPTGCTDPAYVEYGSSNPCSTPVSTGDGSGTTGSGGSGS